MSATTYAGHRLRLRPHAEIGVGANQQALEAQMPGRRSLLAADLAGPAASENASLARARVVPTAARTCLWTPGPSTRPRCASILHYAAHHLQARIVAEAYRVLKPGGVLFLFEDTPATKRQWRQVERWGPHQQLRAALGKALLPQHPRMGYPPAFRGLPVGGNHRNRHADSRWHGPGASLLPAAAEGL